MTVAQMAPRTADWLVDQARRFGQPACIVYDCPVDFELLKPLLQHAGRWLEVRSMLQPLHVHEHLDRLDSNLAAEAAYDRLLPRGLHRHHALADAHALRAAHYALLTGKYLKS